MSSSDTHESEEENNGYVGTIDDGLDGGAAAGAADTPGSPGATVSTAPAAKAISACSGAVDRQYWQPRGTLTKTTEMAPRELTEG